MIFMQDNAGIINFCNEGESSRLQANWFFSSMIESRKFIKELCKKGEISFIDAQIDVDVAVLKQRIKGLKFL